MGDRALDGWSMQRIMNDLNRRGVAERRKADRGTTRRCGRCSSTRRWQGFPLVLARSSGRVCGRRSSSGPGGSRSLRPSPIRPASVSGPVRKYLLSGLVESAKGDPMGGKPEKGKARGYTSRPGVDRRGNAVPARMLLSIGTERLDAFVTEAVMIALRDYKPGAPDSPRSMCPQVRPWSWRGLSHLDRAL